MYMAYTTNPHLPKVRMDAVRLVRAGWSTRAVARHLGFNQSSIVKWKQRAPSDPRLRTIPTCSSKPHHHPTELSNGMIMAVINYRIKYRRCAEVIHYLLTRDGYPLSLSSVKRVLRRQGLITRSPWKRWHQSIPRPLAEKPGILVQIDTIHLGPANEERLHVYTLLDVFTRWAYAMVTNRITTHRSYFFVKSAQAVCPVQFQTLQSDHGQEFSTWFTEHIQKQGYCHRHSRVRKPTDNGHVERFNRTLQDECLHRIPTTYQAMKKALPEYLHYYNTERPHLSLHMKSPLQVMPSY